MYSPPDPNKRKYDLPGGAQDFGFEEPTTVDKAKDLAEDAGDFVKRHWWKAVIVLVLLVVVFFVFDFFIGSIKQVSFRIVDTEGVPLSGVGIKVFDASGEEIERIGGNETIDLQRGSYTVSVALSGFKQKRGVSLEVSQDLEVPVEIELEKDLELELEVEDFPSELVEGQRTGVFVTIKNNRTKQETVDLVFEGALDTRYMTTQYNGPILAPAGESRAYVEMNLKDSIKESLIKDGLKGTIRIKGLNNPKARKQVTFDLREFDRRKLRLSGSLKFGTIVEGAPGKKKDITIENRFDFPIENVQFEVDIKSTEFSQASEVEQWFSFDRDVPIDLPAGDRTKVGVIVNVPIGIQFERSAEKETISGKLFVRTSFWEEDIPITLTAEKSEVGLRFSGISKTYSIRFNSSTGQYDPEPGILTLKNDGELPLKLVNLDVDCDTTGTWVASNVVNFDQTLFSEIPAGEEKKTNYTIIIPNAADKGDVVSCTLSAKYDDPREGPGSDRLSTELPFIININ